MEPSRLYRPRVSRETRQLLIAGALAIAALWLLARFRFRDLPVTPNPIPAVISQLTSSPKFDDLAGEIGQLQTRLEPSLLAVVFPSAAPGTPQTSGRVAALRLRDDMAMTWLSAESTGDHANLLARDSASGLAIVRVVGQAAIPFPAPWTPRQLQQPRYLIASDVSANGVSLRPAFVGSLDPMESSLWPEPLWAVPTQSDLAPGSFVFTSNLELVGLVISYGVERVIVPGGTLRAEADRLLARPKAPAGSIGIAVQTLTEPVASVTGAHGGVVITWVERAGAGTGRVMVGDVIEALDGRALATRQSWDVRMARLSANETVTLRVRSGGEVKDVALVATAVAAPPERRSLGLTLRGRARIGAEIVRVERASAADRAGLAPGDLITLVADVDAPTPAQVTRSFGALREGQRLMVAVTRADAHFVTTLER
jgi:hypothetical protein